MKTDLKSAVFSFQGGNSVKWRYLGLEPRYHRKEKRYAIQVRVETVTPCIDQFFETWDKPSEHKAAYFIKKAIKK